MSLPTPCHSVSHKRFRQCVNQAKKLSLRHPLPAFGSLAFFRHPFDSGVDKVLQKLTKSYKNELKHLFQYCILIPRKCPSETPFQHTVGVGELEGTCLPSDFGSMRIKTFSFKRPPGFYFLKVAFSQKFVCGSKNSKSLT